MNGHVHGLSCLMPSAPGGVYMAAPFGSQPFHYDQQKYEVWRDSQAVQSGLRIATNFTLVAKGVSGAPKF